jgi:hypothetical protein
MRRIDWKALVAYYGSAALMLTLAAWTAGLVPGRVLALAALLWTAAFLGVVTEG